MLYIGYISSPYIETYMTKTSIESYMTKIIYDTTQVNVSLTQHNQICRGH